MVYNICMKIFTFKGGIYPPERKELSRDCPITDAFPSTKTVTIPVTMGGAPNTPLVKVGDIVAKGQKIAASDKFMSAPVHSSVAGTVKKIQNCMVTGNMEVPCIVIESDGSDRTDYMPPLDPFTCDEKDAIARIRDAGIVGMGGASFPTHVKLSPPPDKEIEYVLLNAAECEPYLTIDDRTMQEETEKVIDGLAIVLRLMGAEGIIALETNKDYIKPLLEKEIAAKGYGDDIKVALVKTKYPQGCEKNIVEAVLGREIPAGALPADAGTIIINVGTVCAISDAFRLGKPLIERSLTISGGACEKPCNIRVPVGTMIGDLIPEVFTLKAGKTAKIVSGGPMMGFAMTNVMFPVAKGTSGITFLTKEESQKVIEKEFNPNIIDTIDRMSLLAKQENDYIDSVVGILSGKKLDKESEWYTSDTMISAPEGYMISLNGENENWTDRIDITEDGLNTINYFLKNIETEYVSHPEKMEVKYDSTDPVINRLSAATDTDSSVITVDCVDETSGIKSIEVTSSNGGKIVINDNVIRVSGLSEGTTYIFEITVTDNAGRTSVQTIKITTDVTPPPVPVTEDEPSKPRPSKPGKGESDVPENPDDPVKPVNPDKPDIPDVPDTPDVPEILDTWALMNLIEVIAAAVLVLVAMVRKQRNASIASVVMTIVSGTVFFFTENMKNKMVLFDKYSIIMGVALIVQIVLMIFLNKKEEEEESAE